MASNDGHDGAVLGLNDSHAHRPAGDLHPHGAGAADLLEPEVPGDPAVALTDRAPPVECEVDMVRSNAEQIATALAG